MKGLHIISWILLVIGGLNFGLMGIGVGDLVAKLGSGVATVVYILFGIAAIVEIVTHKKNCGCCTTSSASSTPSQTM